MNAEKTLIRLALLIIVLMCFTPSCKESKHAIPEFEVPAWAEEVVWYQIFPERFRNGDSTNDPTITSIAGAWPHDTLSPWQLHPWDSDWYEMQDYEKANGQDLWYNIQRRRYGGDLQGIIDKLEYLKELGIGAIYLNPVFMAPSHHKYDGACYHHIDPWLGPDPQGDIEIMATENPLDPNSWKWTAADKQLLEMTSKAHNLGIRIILDGVFNHMGVTSFAFKDLKEKQQSSAYKDWFKVKSWQEPEKGSSFDYEAWWGAKDLPELNDSQGNMATGPKDYIFAAVKRWMLGSNDHNGIDGWRLDVAAELPHAFWKDFRNYVKSIKPQAYLTAELIDSVNNMRPYLKGDEFDAAMNYNFMFACSEFFIKGKAFLSVGAFDSLLQEQRNAFPGCVNKSMQNLLASHDTDRPGSRIINKRIASFLNWSHYFNKAKATNRWYNNRKPKRKELDVLKLMGLFQFTYVGAPMIYYGDEVGMWGGGDPCCRKPMIWDDINFSEARKLPNGHIRKQADKVKTDAFLLNHYKMLTRLRNNNKVLQNGDFQSFLIDNINDIYGFKRFNDTDELWVLLNNSAVPRRTIIQTDTIPGFRDVLNGNKQYRPSDGKLSLIVPPKWGLVLELLKE